MAAVVGDIMKNNTKIIQAPSQHVAELGKVSQVTRGGGFFNVENDGRKPRTWKP